MIYNLNNGTTNKEQATMLKNGYYESEFLTKSETKLTMIYTAPSKKHFIVTETLLSTKKTLIKVYCDSIIIKTFKTLEEFDAQIKDIEANTITTPEYDWKLAEEIEKHDAELTEKINQLQNDLDTHLQNLKENDKQLLKTEDLLKQLEAENTTETAKKKPKYTGYGYHGGGRKPTGRNPRKRDKTLSLKFSESELEALKKAQKESNLSMTDFILHLIQ